ncbi:hypothetical protein [Serinicoccus marinus]|uniref:hypothetical protein n=1 Tax=Serinicoccus marinus TaxID=247333 RepID=UPI00122E2A9A|nr:hypothetical protein [Serinicoccus marinus]
MARRRRATLERSRRQVAGLAEDGLRWGDFAAAAQEVIDGIVPHDAAVLALVDPVSGILTDTFRTGLDDSLDELFIRLELTHPDPITMTTLTGRPDGVGILADHIPAGLHSTPGAGAAGPPLRPRARDAFGGAVRRQHGGRVRALPRTSPTRVHRR